MPASPVEAVGFSEGYSVSTVVEAIRQSLVLDDRWGFGLCLASLDVKQAFDEMSHREVAKAVYTSGGDLLAGIAIMGEMQGMRGVATLGEAAPTPKFDMTK
eukprot:9604080-Heterocapsa_arctica.AAC.1